MTDKEREELIAFMLEFKKKIDGNKELAQQFLIEVGIYTEDGKLAEPYRHLHFPTIEEKCTPVGQD
jgi:hypothetical protein